MPQSGKISIDGIDIRQLDPSEIRENIGYVSQEPWLIAGTIEQNISLGATEIKVKILLKRQIFRQHLNLSINTIKVLNRYLMKEERVFQVVRNKR